MTLNKGNQTAGVIQLSILIPEVAEHSSNELPLGPISPTLITTRSWTDLPLQNDINNKCSRSKFKDNRNTETFASASTSL